jgi:hypothetical protein
MALSFSNDFGDVDAVQFLILFVKNAEDDLLHLGVVLFIFQPFLLYKCDFPVSFDLN